jgi:uncharacterized protein (DUF1697 family)
VSTQVALLRGINLAAKNRISMADLTSVLSAMGLEDVTTYLQSGNVVFRSSSAARRTADAIEGQIAKAFGLDVTVLLRTPAELRKIAGGNPFLANEPDPVKLHVVFLDAKPAAKAKTQLDPERSPPDQFALRGREIYLHLPSGSARSKLTLAYFERQLGVKATARNWKTVTRLVELAEQL